MKRQLAALAAAALAAIASALPASAFTPKSAAATHALEWLQTLQSADGTVAGSASRTEGTVFGLVANGKAVTSFATSGKTTIDSLRTHLADEEKTAGNIGGLIIAGSAAGLTPPQIARHKPPPGLPWTHHPSPRPHNNHPFKDPPPRPPLPAAPPP